MRRFQSKARAIPWRSDGRRGEWPPLERWPRVLRDVSSAPGVGKPRASVCAMVLCALGSLNCSSPNERADEKPREPADAAVSPTSMDVAPHANPTYLKASNSGAGDSFGAAVALSSDGHTLAVAASFEASANTGVNAAQDNDAATRAGAVYVFTQRAGDWRQQAYIKASHVNPEARFGSALAMSADGNTLVVGAPGDAGGANGIYGDLAADPVPGSGAVYVFERDGESWTETAYLKANNLAKDDAFGISLALSADGNTLAVGAEQEDSLSSGVDSGAVYVFSRSGGTWQQDSYLKAANAQTGDKFGGAVAISTNGRVLAVGAYAEDSGAMGVNGDANDNSNERSGAVYVFTKDDEWTQHAYLKPASNNGAGGDAFGCSVSLSADGKVLAVGAAGEASAATGINGGPLDASAPYAGAAYVFTGADAQWEQMAYIKASNTSEGDEFGFHVVLSADGKRLFVGAALEDSASAAAHAGPMGSSADSGAVYVFDHNGATFEQRAFIQAPGAGPSDRFGWALAPNGDGDRLIVGAIGEAGSSAGVNGDPSDRTLPGAGAVYVFDGLLRAVSE